MAADKARYYLEQSIPELHEYEKKKIFTKVPTPTFRILPATDPAHRMKSPQSPRNVPTLSTALMPRAVMPSTSRAMRNTK